ncbi:MAG: YncE family protein [Alkalispirochaeta sp.]
MSEDQLQRIVSMVMTAAAVALVIVLGVGVARGDIRPGAGSQGRSGSGGLFAPAHLFDADQEHGLVVAVDGGRRLLSVTVPDGTVNAAVDLPGRAATIVPTPGGVSVWVTFADRREIEIYSTTDLSHQATVRPESGGGNIPASLTFSENGDTLFVTWQEDARISIYRHEMRELTLLREVASDDAAGTAGPVVRNRRATRIYRVEESGNLAAFFVQNGQRLDSISVPGGGAHAEAPPVFTADYTAAWALTETGDLVGIDAAQDRAYRRELDFEPAPGHAPVMVGEEPRGLVVRSDERGVHRVDLLDIENPEESGRVDLASEGVDSTIVAMVAAGNGAALLVTADGALVTIDGRSLELVETAEIRDGDQPIEPRTAAAWTINEEGNFACF